MRKLIETFTTQLADALNNGSVSGKVNTKREINSLIICGMGGSGIGGKVVLEWLAHKLSIPCITHNSYAIPNWANHNTLVIISSYSGNTEETLSAMEAAMAKDCLIGAITSGGKVTDWAEKYKIPYISVDGGHPPRSQFGQSVVQLCRMLESFRLITSDIYSELFAATELLNKKQLDIRDEAEKVAEKLKETTPIIYTGSSYEGVGIRWRQQLNENSKVLCWHHHFPEMNHNELVGWETGNNSYSVILLCNEDDPQRVKVRMEISKTIFLEKSAQVIEIHSKGNSVLERSLYLIHLGDWVSLLLAEITNTDPVVIKNIDLLKNKLAEVN